MAKKKGRRTINVARKREKRNRDRKSRQKQLALEKQRKLVNEKSEEEYLHACIAASRKLLDEPEFEGILFDPELMQKRVMEVLSHIEAENENILIDPPERLLEPEDGSTYLADVKVDEALVNDEQQTPMSEAEKASDHFRLEVLPHLVTPDFMGQLTRALTACEKRLKLTGNRDLAEVAFVTSSLFEAAPPEILAFHPMIQTIGIETLRIVVEELDVVVDGGEGVKGILSDVLAQEDSETSQSQPMAAFSNAGLDETMERSGGVESAVMKSAPPYVGDVEKTDSEDALPMPTRKEIDSMDTVQRSVPERIVLQEDVPPVESPPPPTLLPDGLPARALYKNFSGLAIKESFKVSLDDGVLREGLANYALVNENEKQVEFADIENERYITVTEERLQLQARSETELAIAMAEVEAHCTSAVMYLAKMIEERG